MSKTVYLPHGGGPLPLIDEKSYKNMNNYIRSIGEGYRPEAIIVFSAHLETNEVEVIYDNKSKLTYDYYGFPKETYEYKYNPPKNISLGKKIIALLNGKNIKAISSSRGFDHGVFIPLMLMYPKADIPVIQISLKKGLEEGFHISLGESLSSLKNENILFLGSGFSFHNLRELMSGNEKDDKNDQFQDWLINVLTSETNEEVRKESLKNWKSAPNSMYAHPRSEHLIPLHICYGINGEKGKIDFNQEVLNKRTIAVSWNV